MKTIDIGKDFSQFPAGRFLQDGDFTGQLFREQHLRPAIERGRVELLIDGVASLPSSFFEEVVGGLVRDGLPAASVRERVTIVAKTPRMQVYKGLFIKYLDDAEQKRSVA